MTPEVQEVDTVAMIKISLARFGPDRQYPCRTFVLLSIAGPESLLETCICSFATGNYP